jgi:hypothetical protein
LKQSRVESRGKFCLSHLTTYAEAGFCRIAKGTARCIAKKDPQAIFKRLVLQANFIAYDGRPAGLAPFKTGQACS